MSAQDHMRDPLKEPTRGSADRPAGNGPPITPGGRPRLVGVELLGIGGTARVQRARLREAFAGLASGSEVAVKTLHGHLRGNAELEEAFRAEAEAAGDIDVPSLVRVIYHGVHAVGENEGLAYLVMSYVPGRSLREVLDHEGPLPEPLLRRVGAQLAQALAALHEHNLVHGDVKPENARLDEEGRAVLLDLGFARRARGDDPRSQAGSLPYLSPERVRGEPARTPADVFALGVCLFELATGVHPFNPRQRGGSSGMLTRRSIEDADADELLAAIATQTAPRASDHNPAVSPYFDALLARLLARSPADRPSPAELHEILRTGESGTWWREAVSKEGRSPGNVEAQDLRPSSDRTPLVGREEELAILQEALDTSRSGQPSIVWLSGPEGSGKWRLVNEFARKARSSEDPPTYLYARWSQTMAALPAGMLTVLLNRWLALPRHVEPGERERSALGELVSPAVADVLCSLLDPHAQETIDASVPTALGLWVRNLAERTPVVLFLDDLHDAGRLTWGALGAFISAAKEARMLLVLGLREDVEASEPVAKERVRARLGTELLDGRLQHIELGALTKKDVRNWVEILFHPRTPRIRLAHVLSEKGHGNPGLMSEILEDLIQRGDATPAGDEDPRLVLHTAPESIRKPRSLERLISERSKLLAADERRWLERLSVVGGRIRPTFLMRAFPPTGRAEVDRILSRLVHKGWLMPIENRYRFERPALREAIYRGLTPGRRCRLHEAAARGLLDGDDGDPTTEEAFQRAFHLHAAEKPDELLVEVLELLRPLGQHLSAARVLSLSRWGLQAAGERAGLERERLELYEAAADAADRLGLREEQRELLDELADLHVAVQNQPAESARLYLLHGRHAASTGQLGLARGLLRNAQGIAKSANDKPLQSEALRRLAQVQAQVGQFLEARNLAQRALRLAVGANQKALAHLALGHNGVLEDRIEEALEEIDKALKGLRGARDVRYGVVAYAHLLRSRVYRSTGLAPRALGSIRRALRLARRAGERRLEAESLARQGALMLDLNRPEEAQVYLSEAKLVADEIEDRRGQVLSGLWLGLLQLEQNELDGAKRVGRARTLAQELGFFRAEALSLAILARCARHRGEHDEAEVLSSEAIQLFSRHGAEFSDRLAIVGTRAIVLRSLGRLGEAKRLETELRHTVRGTYNRRELPALHEAQKEYAERLLGAVLSEEGPVFPRSDDLIDLDP